MQKFQKHGLIKFLRDLPLVQRHAFKENEATDHRIRWIHKYIKIPASVLGCLSSVLVTRNTLYTQEREDNGCTSHVGGIYIRGKRETRDRERGWNDGEKRDARERGRERSERDGTRKWKPVLESRYSRWRTNSLLSGINNALCALR